MNNQLLIGLTGGIGSGKSTVSRFWSVHAGIELIDIDQVCRELVKVDEPGWFALKENIDDTFFKNDGQLDRTKLRTAIFDDDPLRIRINELIHPLAFNVLRSRSEKNDKPLLVDVPLLFEAGWNGYFNCIVVVYADQQTCCARIVRRDEIAPQEATNALVDQMDI